MMRNIIIPLFVMLALIGSITPVKAQEIIEYDYECTRYEDESENTYGIHDKVRVRFENDKVSLNLHDKYQKWYTSDGGDYLWLEFDYDGMTDDNMAWFKYFSDDHAKDLGWNEFLIISDDRSTLIYMQKFTDKYKKENNRKDKADIYTRSAGKSSKKPSWMK